MKELEKSFLLLIPSTLLFLKTAGQLWAFIVITRNILVSASLNSSVVSKPPYSTTWVPAQLSLWSTALPFPTSSFPKDLKPSEKTSLKPSPSTLKLMSLLPAFFSALLFSMVGYCPPSKTTGSYIVLKNDNLSMVHSLPKLQIHALSLQSQFFLFFTSFPHSPFCLTCYIFFYLKQSHSPVPALSLLSIIGTHPKLLFTGPFPAMSMSAWLTGKYTLILTIQ